MGPVRQNPIWRTVRTAHLSVLMTVHNFQYTVQHRTVLIIPPSYLQTIIIAQMLSIGGEGGILLMTPPPVMVITYITSVYTSITYLELERLQEKVFLRRQCCDKQVLCDQSPVVSRLLAGYRPFPSRHLLHTQYAAFLPPRPACDPTISG